MARVRLRVDGILGLVRAGGAFGNIRTGFKDGFSDCCGNAERSRTAEPFEALEDTICEGESE